MSKLGLTAALLALSVVSASAGVPTYGTPTGCGGYSGPPDGVWGEGINLNTIASFDGKYIDGENWECAIQSGHCFANGDETTWTSKIRVSTSADTATIKIDAVTYTLPRCEP